MSRYKKISSSAFFAIVKLTISSTIRSRFFQFVLILLICCSILMPLFLKGDGTPISELQISIEYTLLAISLIITLSSIWTGCHAMCYDISRYQLHLISVKPVHRYTIWFGKYSGIVIIHTLLLIISTAIVYFMIVQKVDDGNYPPAIVNKIHESILVGRKSYFPEITNLKELYNKELTKQESIAREKNEKITEYQLKKMKKDILYSIISQEGKVSPDTTKIFKYKNVIKIKPADIILQYKPFIGLIDALETQYRKESRGLWSIKDKKQNDKFYFSELNSKNENLISNHLYEITLPPGSYILKDNTITLKFRNLDSEQPIFFQLLYSPELKIKYTGFLNNYVRCFLISFIGLLLITAISCALSGIFSFPIAIFCITAYLILGTIGSFIISNDSLNNLQINKNSMSGYELSTFVLKGVTPIQKFQYSHFLSEGKLIEYRTIKDIILNYVLWQGLIFMFLGIYFYSRKELGLAKKE